MNLLNYKLIYNGGVVKVNFHCIVLTIIRFLCYLMYILYTYLGKGRITKKV